MNASRSPGRSRLTALLVVVAVAAVTVLAVGVGAEFYARHKISSCLADAIDDEVGGPVEVGFGATPILFSALSHELGRLDVGSDAMDLRSPGGTVLSGIALDSRFSSITLPRDHTPGSVGSSTATVTWPTAAMEQTAQSLPFGFAVTDVRADRSTDEITVEFLEGLGAVSMRPQITGEAITLTATDVQALGFGLPPDFAQQVIDLFTGQLAEYPLGLRPRSAEVTADGLRIELRGDRAEIDPDSRYGADCGLI